MLTKINLIQSHIYLTVEKSPARNIYLALFRNGKYIIDTPPMQVEARRVFCIVGSDAPVFNNISPTDLPYLKERVGCEVELEDFQFEAGTEVGHYRSDVFPKLDESGCVILKREINPIGFGQSNSPLTEKKRIVDQPRVDVAGSEEIKIKAINDYIDGFKQLNLSVFDRNSIITDFSHGWDACITSQPTAASFTVEDLKQVILECWTQAQRKAIEPITESGFKTFTDKMTERYFKQSHHE